MIRQADNSKNGHRVPLSAVAGRKERVSFLRRANVLPGAGFPVLAGLNPFITPRVHRLKPFDERFIVKVSIR